MIMLIYTSRSLNKEIYIQTHHDMPKNIKKKEGEERTLQGRRTWRKEEKGRRRMRWGRKNGEEEVGRKRAGGEEGGGSRGEKRRGDGE